MKIKSPHPVSHRGGRTPIKNPRFLYIGNGDTKSAGKQAEENDASISLIKVKLLCVYPNGT